MNNGVEYSLLFVSSCSNKPNMNLPLINNSNANAVGVKTFMGILHKPFRKHLLQRGYVNLKPV